MPASMNAGPKSITAFEIDPIFNFAGYNRQVPFQLPVFLIQYLYSGNPVIYLPFPLFPSPGLLRR